MHELSLVENLFEQLTQMKKKHGLKEITDVHLSVGEISGVDLEFFRNTYNFYVDRAKWPQLQLHLKQEPWTIRCRQCSHEQKVIELLNQCEKCESQETETILGNEFIIQRIEGVNHV